MIIKKGDIYTLKDGTRCRIAVFDTSNGNGVDHANPDIHAYDTERGALDKDGKELDLNGRWADGVLLAATRGKKEYIFFITDIINNRV